MNALDRNRAVGCLLGLACGDAVGASVEFLPRGRFLPLTDMTGGGKFQLDKGYWTDDTSMALCLADSLLTAGGFDAADQMKRYCHWLDTGYNSSKPRAFGVGKTVLKALLAYMKSGDPYSGPTASRYSGNGSLMRLAPIPLFYFNHPGLAGSYAIQSSRTTHGSGECLEACQYFSHILIQALSGVPKEGIFECSDLCETEFIRHIYEGDFRRKSENEIKGSGFAIESLEAAIWVSGIPITSKMQFLPQLILGMMRTRLRRFAVNSPGRTTEAILFLLTGFQRCIVEITLRTLHCASLPRGWMR